MPAEQEVRGIANDAVEHDGWLDPVDMMRLARAYLALEAELLAAQERAEKAEYDALMANKVVEANSVARWQSVETKRAQRLEAELAVAQERLQVEQIANKNQYNQLIAAQEREKALREALEPFASALLTDAQIKRGSIMWRVPTNWIIAAKAAFRD